MHVTYTAHLCQQPQHEAFDTVHQSQLVPPPNVLQLAVLGPSVHRPLVVEFDDIDKASILHPLGALVPDGESLAESVSHFDNNLAPCVVEVVGSHAVVVGNGLDRVLDDLDPAAGLGVCVGLLEKKVPVGYAAEQLADVYKVKVVWGPRPFQRHVVNLKVAVGRDPLGLDGGEVGAGDGRGGVLVGHVLHSSAARSWCRADTPYNCPYAGAGADVEDRLRISDGRKMQLLVQRQEIHVVRKVEDLLGQLVVGAPVGAIAVGVVLAAVFHAVVEDGRG
jgi:hypothetical protein